tara:strand:- start:81225 stop:81719 length:495 start_codon:yes stop_codon:yes gene_type:complete
MSKSKDIKNIINKNAIDKAPMNFTEEVMKDVFLMSDSELLKDDALSSLLQRTIIEQPSESLVNAVLSQVEVENKMVYQPLISKRGWVVIFSVLIGFVLFVLFYNTSTASTGFINIDTLLPYLKFTESLLSNPFKGMVFSPLLAISLLCISTLLFVDTFLKKRSF